MKCHQTRLQKNNFVCGKCFGYCERKIDTVSLLDKRKVDICNNCNGIYRPI